MEKSEIRKRIIKLKGDLKELEALKTRKYNVEPEYTKARESIKKRIEVLEILLKEE